MIGPWNWIVSWFDINKLWSWINYNLFNNMYYLCIHTEFTTKRSKSRKLLFSFCAINQSVNRCHFIRSTHRMNVQNKSRIFTSISIICIRNVVSKAWYLKYCKNILRDFATRPSKNFLKFLKILKKIFEKERPRNRIQAKGQHCIIRQVFFLNLNMNLSLINLSLNLSPDELFNVGENLNRQVSTFLL